MGWSQVVHQNRKKAELSRALDEFKRRKRGYDIEVKPNGGMPALLALAGVLSGAAWWRRSSRKLAGRDWRKLPVIQQVLDFLHQGKQGPRAAVRGKSKPRQVQPVRKPATGGAAPGSSSSRPTTGGSGGGGVAPVSPGTVQRQSSGAQASTSSSSAAGSSQTKKKKSKKKKK